MVIQTRNNNATKNKEWDCMYSKDSSHFHLNAHANIMSKTKKLTEWCCYSPAIDGFEFVIGDGDEQSGEKGRMRELITVQSIEGVGGYTIYSFDFSSYKQHSPLQCIVQRTTYLIKLFITALPQKPFSLGVVHQVPTVPAIVTCTEFYKQKQKRMKI